jgi:hypothetical protein
MEFNSPDCFLRSSLESAAADNHTIHFYRPILPMGTTIVDQAEVPVEPVFSSIVPASVAGGSEGSIDKGSNLALDLPANSEFRSPCSISFAPNAPSALDRPFSVGDRVILKTSVSTGFLSRLGVVTAVKNSTDKWETPPEFPPIGTKIRFKKTSTCSFHNIFTNK